MTCLTTLQAALEREQEANRQLREALAAMSRESGEKSEEIRYLKQQLAEARGTISANQVFLDTLAEEERRLKDD